MIYFCCKNCDAINQVEDRLARAVVLCSRCKTGLRVPPASTHAATSAAAPPTIVLPLPPRAEWVPADKDDGKIRFLCPGCRSRLRSAPGGAGQVATCRCGQRMVVPAPPGADDEMRTPIQEIALVPHRPTGRYYYKAGPRWFGPLTAQELRSHAGAGRLRPSDLVRKEGKSTPRPASKLKGLFPRSARKRRRGAEIHNARTELIAETPVSGPETLDAPLVERAIALAETGAFADAIAALTQIIVVYPRSGRAHAARAIIQVQWNGDHERAVTDLTRAIECSPSEPTYYEFRASFRRILGDAHGADADQLIAGRLQTQAAAGATGGR